MSIEPFNLNQTNVEINDAFVPVLKDLQANILKHHGREFAFHVFLNFKDLAKTKTWLKSFVKKHITSTYTQLNQSEEFRNLGKGDDTICTLSLSSFGYHFINKEKEMPEDIAFKTAMKKRESILNDKVENWEIEFKKDIHCLVIIANKFEDKAIETLQQITKEVSDFASIVKIQRGKVLRNEHGIGIEHFGYADGISQPIYLKKEIDKMGKRDIWDDKAMLDKLLVLDKGGRYEHSFGSLLVFRKLEQNVKAFKSQEKLLKKVKDYNGENNDELAGAMIVGRFEDGNEVISHSVERGITNENQFNNNFNYKHDNEAIATKCPFHSHIRLTNPRSDIEENFAKATRITRRGIPFNDVYRNEKDLENDQPEKGVGLLFMCYQSSIAQQFEFIQSQWVNQGNINNKLVGQDGIIGQGHNDTQKHLPEKWGKPKSKGCEFNNDKSGFVKMKGGEYFFTPSISFIETL